MSQTGDKDAVCFRPWPDTAPPRWSPTIHPANEKPLASASTDLPPSPHRTPSLNPTLNVDSASTEKLSSPGGSRPGRNHRSLSFLKQMTHGQHLAACQARSRSPGFSPHASRSPLRSLLNFTAGGTWSWPKLSPQESLLSGFNGSPRQQLSSGWLLNAPLGFLFPSPVLDCGEEVEPRQGQET